MLHNFENHAALFKKSCTYVKIGLYMAIYTHYTRKSCILHLAYARFLFCLSLTIYNGKGPHLTMKPFVCLFERKYLK